MRVSVISSEVEGGGMSAFVITLEAVLVHSADEDHAEGLLCARLSALHRLSHGIIILTPQSRHF